jgi:hypothetical protein
MAPEDPTTHYSIDESTDGSADRTSRRRFLKAAAVVGGLAGLSYLVGRGILFREDDPSIPAGVSVPPNLRELADNMTSGGPPKDGIPPIDEPQFVAAAGAGFLNDDDVVFGIMRDGQARAYPQLVLVWHEIVNDRFSDGPLSVTYCPLTGSTVGFRGTAPGGKPYTFGTSGDLVNSNLLMYDRQTDSQWPQILGQAITGPATREMLTEIPLDWTTWGRWRDVHPDTDVLSTKTGHIRDYGRDPYGSYTPPGGYYEDPPLFFQVLHEDDRFPNKEVFIGVKSGRARLAVRKSTLRDRGVVQKAIGRRLVALLYDPELDAGRAYVAEVGGNTVRLRREDEPGQYVDALSDTVWDPSGTAVSGDLRGNRLKRLPSYDVMWFAWAAFFPNTQVVA